MCGNWGSGGGGGLRGKMTTEELSRCKGDH